MQLTKYNPQWALMQQLFNTVEPYWYKLNFNWDSLPLSNHATAIQIATRMYSEWEADKANASCPKHYQDYQRNAVIDMLANVLQKENTLLIAGTGTGKTYMILMCCDILFYHGYHKHACKSRPIIPFPILYLVNASAVPQIMEVVAQYTNLRNKCFVMNYEQLNARQSLGSIMMKWKKVGKDVYNEKLKELVDEDKDGLYIPEWNEQLAPIIVIEDEVQKLKNNTAARTKSMQSFSITNPNTIQILASATPFVRPSESKTTCLALKPICDIPEVIELGNNIIRFDPNIITDTINPALQKSNIERITERVNIDNYTDWLSFNICTRTDPIEYSPAAMERLTNHLSFNHNLVHVKDVKFAHKSLNKHILIDFQSPSEQKQYIDAFIEYCMKLAKANKNTPQGLGAIFAAKVKFQKKAEWIRRYHLAKMISEQECNGRNVICAFKYKDTLEAVGEILVKDYGYKSEDLSYIIGGQSKKSREENKHKFQTELSHIMLMMQQAGGTGISLHHYKVDAKYTDRKPFNKRPRFVTMSLVWGIIDMLQVLGRAHRINSASTTHQWLLWYKGTIEEEIYARLANKALSMRELMRKKEQWSDLFTNPEHQQYTKRLNTLQINDNQNEETNEDDQESANDTWNTDAELISDNVETIVE